MSCVVAPVKDEVSLTEKFLDTLLKSCQCDPYYKIVTSDRNKNVIIRESTLDRPSPLEKNRLLLKLKKLAAEGVLQFDAVNQMVIIDKNIAAFVPAMRITNINPMKMQAHMAQELNTDVDQENLHSNLGLCSPLESLQKAKAVAKENRSRMVEMRI